MLLSGVLCIMLLATCSATPTPSHLQFRKYPNGGGNDITDLADKAVTDVTNPFQRAADNRVSKDGTDVKLTEEFSFGTRKKRAHKLLSLAAWTGYKAMMLLLRSSKTLRRNEFEKYGNYERAIVDFYSVNPTMVKNIEPSKGLFMKKGTVGDRTLIVSSKGKTGNPTLKIIQRDGKDKEHAIEIIYTEM